ncbi:MAG TPA: adenylate/guanylate cyclase domain-containing protein [Leptospiraceae bacterium]|nr:adenylate/guanylate cyclase domain-containing protein [Leptospiraceae bacterium]HMX34324.1 adenylate/guanylate cyclase domain-containing protein [Leptospiraceae bacterium]HMY33079.1 adenylate/guanylate cyclase domain-containing protein [Leptospiraceae bacterium]HMZ65547.1 adenylate/guanylate cyclase domain-containing protein [Leptospiraceae bacterium]HNA09577.1 adenylate/guanylate cyclase domain-containing protein [Leptospiraceae bacterium]
MFFRSLKKISFLFYLINLLFLFNVFANETTKENDPKSIQGILDLRNQKFYTTEADDGFIKLDGEWEFYWNEFIDPNLLRQPNNYIQVPSNWNEQTIKYFGENIHPPANGYASYRIKLLLPEQTPDLAISVEGIDSAYSFFINGVLYSSKGKVGRTIDEMEALNQSSYFSIPKLSEMDIVIHVSNFHHRKAGIRDAIFIGNYSVIEGIQKRNHDFDLILSSCLLIMGLYHVGLYITRRKDRSPLHFSIFCILIAVRTVSINDRMILGALPLLNFTVVHKLEFVSFYYSSWAFMQFLHYLFPDEFSKKWYWFFASVLVPSSLLVIVTHSSIYTGSLIFVQITILLAIFYSLKVIIAAIVHNRVGAKFFFFGMILFFVSIINDILKSMDIVHTPYMTSYGFISFVLFQAMVLSGKFANAFLESERLALELKAFSESLELKVEERTRSLEEARKQAEIEKNLAFLAQKETQKQKEETEELNLLIKSLNEELDIKLIMKKVKNYIFENYNINHYALYIVNSSRSTISLLDADMPDRISKEDQDKIRSLEIPIGNGEGAHAYVLQTQKPLYIPKVLRTGVSKEELSIIETANIQSFFMIPLFLQSEPIGIIDFSSDERMKLSENDVTRLSILGEQLAGVIYGSNLYKQVQEEKEKSDRLLLNILPKEIAVELKEKGFSEPISFESVSVLFTDFKGFTQIAEKLPPSELVKELDACFVQFDKITERYNLEKLKTIGDSYMCAGGIPTKNRTHAIDCVLAAIEIQSFMEMMKDLKTTKGFSYWELRLGIHSGPIVAGVIGEKKFAYDVWGDTVNTASRMESSGTPGKINVSGSTYQIIRKYFECEYRGMVKAKNKGEVEMYYVLGLKKEFSIRGDGKTPNEEFWKEYRKI